MRDLNSNKVAKYLKGNATLKERDNIENMIAKSKEYRHQFNFWNKLWKHADLRYHSDQINTKEEWKRLEKLLYAELDDKKISAPRSRGKLLSWSNFRSVPSRTRIYYAAAAIAVFTIVGYVIIRVNPQPVFEEKQYGEIRIEDPQIKLLASEDIKSFDLPDNSGILLDQGSSLTYAGDYNNVDRQVELVGRAFFDVEENPDVPFIIRTKNTQIKVLGTSFNVDSRPESDDVEVSVVSGKVLFSADGSSVTLVKGERGRYISNERIIEKSDHEGDEFLSWMTEEEPSDLPLNQLNHTFEWRKNLLSQTVVEGVLVNNSNETFQRVLLRIQCYNESQNKEFIQEYTLDGPLNPNEKLEYKKTFLIDWLSKTSKVTVKIEDGDLAD